MTPATPPPSSRATRRTVVLAGAAAAAALTGTGTATGAARPARGTGDAPRAYAPYWFPDSLPEGPPDPGVVHRSLKTWRPEDDPDLPFNRSTVPLAARFTPVPAHTTARAGQAGISALAAFGHTSGNPSQGGATAEAYAFSHWAYLDELVFWGGSAGEGLIVAPNAPVVDAAHRNGVPVLGTVFLPPVHHGGKLRWARELVQQDDRGGYPLADKLAEAATALGFDGWFVNAETEGGDTRLAAHTRGFLRRLRSLSDTHGLRLTWYDAMTSDGDVEWQGALNGRNQDFFQDGRRRVADTMFLDFRWTPDRLASSGELAVELGRDRYELWAGVDVEEKGRHTRTDWDAFVPLDRPHVTGLGFYRPDWTLHHLPEKDRRDPGRFHAADDAFWSGPALDATRPGDGADAWRAPAAVVADRSTADALPFATCFNTGHGLRWYEEGRVTSDSPWNHLGLQDPLPARRWAVHGEGARPEISLDFADAWRGGSSLLVDGVPGTPATVELYATRLPLTPATTVRLTHRTGPGSGGLTVELALARRESDGPGEPPPYTFLPVAAVPPGGTGWSTVTVDAGALLARAREAGDGPLRALGVRLTAGPGARVSWRLGALAVHDGTGPPAPGRPTRARVTGVSRDGGGTALRLAWQPPRRGRGPAATRHYELHRVLPDGSRRFLGGTCQTVFHLPDLRPEGDEPALRAEIRAIGPLHTAGSPATVVHPW
ncbi:endo-beta-N-acetylglucosaminidase [Streptomyces sp. HNM0574]|uniref:endo-beta-N-acetylglucosaminidase n=1 Tax=Streptomyces sp. HNM0574 TaxID=2714954 RepID=UPI00146F7E13|nr:endo-beta-N-acetylglucosaminidase [Streptomyces sp. HNM0574]